MNFTIKATQAWLLSLCFVISAPAIAALDIQTWQTTNGAKVLFVEAEQLPMLDIEVTFDAGSVRDGDVWGLASFTSSLVGTATSTKNEEQISQTFNEMGAQIGSSASRDSASVSLRTLTRPEILGSALTNFSDLLSDTQFSQSIFDREMERLKIGIKQKSVKPQSISNDKLWSVLYGDHPYAHPSSGSLESVEKIDLKKVKDFYQQYYVAKNAVIAIVGNVDINQAKKISETLTKNLVSGDKPPGLVKPKKVYNNETITIEFDSTQTYYSFAQQGIERGHEDYAPLFVGNHLLGGGGFGSLLMEEVREKRGLVYSVYSYFSPLKVNGPFLIGLSTKNASAKEADKVVKQTLKDFMTGFSDEKLQAIKDNLIGGFPLRMDSNGKILGYLSLIGFYDLPLNYLEWFPKQIEKVTKNDVLTAWKKHVKPGEMVTLMVGKPE